MKKTFYIILYFFANISFLNAMEITEIMYNPEGTDTNREWVEIFNEESSSVDISTWHFFENDTHHGMHPDDFTSLAAGEYALIVKDVDAAKSELGTNIRYIKSSFSLNNTSESISISDADKNIIDTHIYNSEGGANGDGKSLQLVSSSWYNSIPTPGFVNELQYENSDNSNNVNTSEENTVDIKIPKIFNPYYLAEIQIPDVVVAQNSFLFKALVNHIDSEGKKKKDDGYYYINFGNGDYFESSGEIGLPYSYRHAGSYIVTFEYYTSKLAFEYEDEPDAIVKKNITVTAHELEIEEVNSFDGVVIKNNTKKLVDMNSWKIIWKNKEYIFPRHSNISSKNSIHILFNHLGFYPEVSKKYPIQLLSNTYKPISIFPKKVKKRLLRKIKKISKKKKTNNKKKKKTVKIKEAEIFLFNNLPDAKYNFFGESTDTFLDEYLEKNPNKIKVDFDNKSKNADKNTESKKNDYSMYYALSSLVLMLGVGRFIKHNKQKNRVGDDDNLGTIEVIE